MKIDSTAYWIGWFENGIAKISANGYTGLINSQKQIICPPRYDRIFDFHHGVAVVTLNNKYGIIDQSGKEILSPSLAFLADFNRGLAWFCDQDKEEWGIMDTNGKVIREAEDSAIRKYQNDQFTYANRSLFNAKGEEIFHLNLPSFVGAKGERANFSDAKNYVRQSSVIPFLYQGEDRTPITPSVLTSVPPDLLLYYKEGLALFPQNINGQVKLGYMDTQGQPILSPAYDNAHHFIRGKAVVKQGNRWGLMDKTGMLLIPYQYEYLEQTPSDYLIFGQDGKFGIMDAAQNVVVPPEFLRIHHLFANLFSLLKSSPTIDQQIQRFGHQELNMEINTWGALNVLTGETILPFTFHTVSAINDQFGVGVNYQFAEKNATPLFEQTSIPPPRPITGKGICQVFNAKEKSGQYAATDFDFYSSYLGTPAQLKSIVLCYEIDDHYDFNGVFLDNAGNSVEHEELLASLSKRSAPSKRIVSKDDTSGNVLCKSLEGNIIIPPICQSLQVVHTGIIGKKAGKWMFFDLMGKELIPPIYDAIEETRSGILSVRLGSDHYLIDKQKNRLN